MKQRNNVFLNNLTISAIRNDHVKSKRYNKLYSKFT